MNSAFYDSIRPLFGGSLKQSQVDGIERIVASASGLPVPYVAYILATAYHEVGGKMQPDTESLNYDVAGLLKTFSRERISSADAQKYGRTATRAANQEAIANIVYGGDWGRKNLGNLKWGDGWRYRGRGLPQTTGLSNYTKFGIQDAPEKANELDTAVHMLVHGSVKGIYTGKKLGDYLDGEKPDYVGARRVINGTDKASLIASYAVAFESALRDGADIGIPTPKPASSGLIHTIIEIIKGLWK